MSGIREARLRAEASDRFPAAPTGVWLPAGSLATDLKAQRLPDDAFEFRGGRPDQDPLGRSSLAQKQPRLRHERVGVLEE